jgi:hypothetical protein
MILKQIENKKTLGISAQGFLFDHDAKDDLEYSLVARKKNSFADMFQRDRSVVGPNAFCFLWLGL